MKHTVSAKARRGAAFVEGLGVGLVVVERLVVERSVAEEESVVDGLPVADEFVVDGFVIDEQSTGGFKAAHSVAKEAEMFAARAESILRSQ